MQTRKNRSLNDDDVIHFLQEAQQAVATAYRHTEKLLIENKEKLRMVCSVLLHTLTS